MAPSSTTFESLYEAANAADTSPAPPSTPTPTKSSKSQTSSTRSSAKRAGTTTSPITPTKKGRKAPAITPSLTSGPTDWSTVEGWTPEKREAFMNRVIAQGVVAIGTAALAEEFGATKISINNAISAGKKGNLREKAIKAVRG